MSTLWVIVALLMLASIPLLILAAVKLSRAESTKQGMIGLAILLATIIVPLIAWGFIVKRFAPPGTY